MCGVQLHQLREICNARIDGRSLFDVAGGRITDGVSGQVLAHSHLAGIELHIIGGVDLAQHADGTAGIDPDVGSPVLDVFQFGIPVIPCIKIALQDFIGSLIRILKVLGQGRSHDIEGSCIDDAALADDHALGAQEEQVAANLLVADGVQRAIDVNAGIDEVQQVLGFPSVFFHMEIHIGNLIGIQMEILELIDGIVLAVVLLGVDLKDIIISRVILAIGSRDFRIIGCKDTCRAHHEPCGQQCRQHLVRQLAFFSFCFIFGAKVLIFPVDMA